MGRETEIHGNVSVVLRKKERFLQKMLDWMMSPCRGKFKYQKKESWRSREAEIKKEAASRTTDGRKMGELKGRRNNWTECWKE